MAAKAEGQVRDRSVGGRTGWPQPVSPGPSHHCGWVQPGPTSCAHPPSGQSPILLEPLTT